MSDNNLHEVRKELRNFEVDARKRDSLEILIRKTTKALNEAIETGDFRAFFLAALAENLLKKKKALSSN